MSLEIALIFIIILGIIILFAFEVFPVDKISFCLIGTLLLLGLVTPDEAISGFSNRATITILCLMIIAVALEQNGVITWMANGLKRVKNWPIYFIIPLFMLITGSISAFISSTAVVIVFIKIITELSEKYQISESRLLLPISFSSILGGSCTLMGTSTNLIVNSLYITRTEERIGFFEFSWMGIIFLVIAIVVITVLHKVLPASTDKNLEDQYDLDNYILTLEIAPDSALVGQAIRDTPFKDEDHLTLLKLSRKGRDKNILAGNIRLQPGDRIKLSCDLAHLMRLKNSKDFLIAPEEEVVMEGSTTKIKQVGKADKDKTSVEPGEILLVEIMMLPGARFLEKTLKEVRTILANIATPIAIKRRQRRVFRTDRLLRYNVNPTYLRVGDRILVEIEKEKINDLEVFDNIAILQQYEPPLHSGYKRWLSLAILGGVVLLAASGVLHILSSAITGCLALLLTNCITLENVYKKINWSVIILLAGMIPLGVAMHNTGADDWITGKLLGLMHGQDSLVSIGLLFLVTMLISGVVSNNATAIIMTPIAISLASGMDLPIKPYVLAVMFASNFSFFTPVGYQTNALIYSMGHYNFRHFLILGGIISLLLWLVGSFLLNTMIP
ncbi:SLC13 family permease [Zeaxanthinibacter enoshimensis]|uniref:Citrate transporter n=1 Tax=Zeaxanthinibacter enoshimensis TaxID=392009 RepID=A0A4R6TML0_9FLAO|nr:SLC13 family permease [Zeaxanthinibacter enoshimensis]TDQ32752.1 citrate transporter [Zeaxanthinibacter enoshimensis]